MTTRSGAPGRDDSCDIPACSGSRSYLINKLESSRTVCIKCMEELVTAFGWKLAGGPLLETSREQPAVQY